MLVFVTGARPNFIKVKPLIDRCEERDVPYLVYNSNQHEQQMQVFPMGTKKDHPLSSNREGRFVEYMSFFSVFLNGHSVDMVIVTGDTDTTLACALTASMRNIPVAHVEAGLRSFYKMPEEINRRATDAIAMYNFCPTTEALGNLRNEGLKPGILVGNIMIESLIRYWKKTVTHTPPYILAEFHREENDDKIPQLLKSANQMKYPVKWLKHPRYKGKGFYSPIYGNIEYLNPQPYQEMITYVANASLVITDSGGLQPETTYLEVPCITFRKATEWNRTVTEGSNYLVGSIKEMEGIYKRHMSCSYPYRSSGDLWDKEVSCRIMDRIVEHLGEKYIQWVRKNYP